MAYEQQPTLGAMPAQYYYTGQAEKVLLDYVFDLRQAINALDKELAGFIKKTDGSEEWEELSDAEKPYNITPRVRRQLIGMLNSLLNQVVSMGDIDAYNTGIITYEWRDNLRRYIDVNFENGGFDHETYQIIYQKFATLAEYMISRARDGAEKFKFLRPTHSSTEHVVKNLEIPQKESLATRIMSAGNLFKR